MPLIFNEDLALKARLQGIQVPINRGSNSLTNVAVRFSLPQDELATLTFPVVIIDHDSISRDSEREHRGRTYLDYAPEGSATWWTNTAVDYDPALSPYLLEFPIPMNIDYQITALAREKSQLMEIVATYSAEDRIPFRFGSLFIPQDQTVRRMDLLGETGIEAARDADGKRIFRAKYAVRVSTEIIPANYPAIFRVATVGITLNETLRLTP